MDFTSVLIIVIVSAIIAMIAFLFFRRGSNDTTEDAAAADYADALNLLLEGLKAEALSKLREVVSKDSNNVDAYLKIGDILREFGQVQKAINVHKYLTVRRGLTRKQNSDILESLCKDYLHAEQYDQALAVISRILTEDKNIRWAKEMKIQLYERKEEWQKAFLAYKDLNRNETARTRLAVYKVQEGLQLSVSGKEKDAQGCFKEAIKIAPQNPSGYINLAESFEKENRLSDALEVLKQFVEKVPSHSYLAFESIKKILYEGGVYGEIENLYLDIIETQPDNATARLSLAEIYAKKGKLERAIQTCLGVLEKDSSNMMAKKLLVRFYHEDGDNDKAVKEALDLIDESLKQRESIKCTACGYESDEPFWRCPECLEWDTN
ncbi:MAG: tetratricopeptide repeat protein [bacterium]